MADKTQANSIRQVVGNIVDKAGTAFGLPEGELSERIAGNKTSYTGVTPQSKTQGFTYVPGSTAYQTNYNTPTMYPSGIQGVIPASNTVNKGQPTSSGQGSTSQGQMPNTGGYITEEQAVQKGLDWNNLPSGYQKFVPAASKSDGYDAGWRDKALREGKDVNSGEFSRMRELEQQITDRNNALAAAQEEAQIQGAERIYGAEKELLGAQKGEVGTVAKTQRNRLQEQKGLVKADYEANKAKDIRDIEKQQTEGQEQKKGDEETLGRAWRDMTMQVQANMRARGIQDSQYAFSAEGDITKDFNSGLRNLQTSYTKVFDNLSQAVVDVNDTYARENAKLESETAAQTESIDAWERGQIVQIQGQENMSLARKLNAIQDATVKAQNLRAQTQNAIDQQKMALETWLYQFNVQTKAAIEQAAYKNSASSAASTLQSLSQQASLMKNALETGQYAWDAASGTYKTVVGGLPLTKKSVDEQEAENALKLQTLGAGLQQKTQSNAMDSLLTPNVFGAIGNYNALNDYLEQ